MPSGSGFTNTRACTPMPGIVVLARVPCAPSRAALLNSRASLGRQLDSKPWSSRGMFMYYFTNVFIVFFGGWGKEGPELDFVKAIICSDF